MSNKVNLVLLQSVKGLGNKDDVVSVAIPYAKNVLLAQGKAKVADKQALDNMKQKKEKQQKHDQEDKQLFDAVHAWIADGGAIKIQKKSAPNGHLYEKVSAKEIVQALQSVASLKVDPSWIVIHGKLDAIGETSIEVVYKGKKAIVPLTIW